MRTLISIVVSSNSYQRAVTESRRSFFDSASAFLALWSNEKGGVDVADSPASVDKPALFLRSWVVNAFGC
jgi:hypothetical protein